MINLLLATPAKIANIKSSNQTQNINQTNKKGWTALHLAAKKGNKKIVDDLIHKGADPNLITNSGDTMLILAAEGGLYEFCEYLIDNRAYLEATNNLNQTPLLKASIMGQSDVAKLLIENGADVNFYDRKKGSILKQTIRSRYLNTKKKETMASLLIKSGAKINKKDSDPVTTFEYSAKYGLSNTVKLLFLKGAIDTKDPYTLLNKALFLAIENGHYGTYKTLINLKANPGVSFKNGHNALHAAAKGGNIQILSDLLNNYKSLDLNTKDKSFKNYTPLMYAIAHQNNDAAILLIDSGANINTQAKNQTTPLMKAIADKNNEIAKYLIKRGAKINKTKTYRD